MTQLLSLWLACATIRTEFASFGYADSCPRFVISPWKKRIVKSLSFWPVFSYPWGQPWGPLEAEGRPYCYLIFSLSFNCFGGYFSYRICFLQVPGVRTGRTLRISYDFWHFGFKMVHFQAFRGIGSIRNEFATSSSSSLSPQDPPEPPQGPFGNMLLSVSL